MALTLGHMAQTPTDLWYLKKPQYDKLLSLLLEFPIRTNHWTQTHLWHTSTML